MLKNIYSNHLTEDFIDGLSIDEKIALAASFHAEYPVKEIIPSVVFRYTYDMETEKIEEITSFRLEKEKYIPRPLEYLWHCYVNDIDEVGDILNHRYYNVETKEEFTIPLMLVDRETPFLDSFYQFEFSKNNKIFTYSMLDNKATDMVKMIKEILQKEGGKNE